MADRPIIFSAPMVRALLDGRKTQTRRVLNPQPYAAVAGWQKVFAEPPYFEALDHAGKPLPCAVPDGKDSCSPYPKLRYALGDRLYVREAHAFDGPTVRYYATDDVHELRRKRPSIFMPRWASRLTLTVTDVRVQRLCDISLGDCWAEGCETARDLIKTKVIPQGAALPFAEFRDLWNSLHGPDAWAANPWVCAISFKVHRCNIDQMGQP